MADEKMIEFETRLGKQSVALNRILRFPKGLIGYEYLRDFALLQVREGVPFMVLQSLEEKELGLLVADPYTFISDFTVRINDAEQNMLNVERPEQVSILVTVSVPPNKPEETCLNLTGPIIINHESRLAMQVPQSDPNQPGKIFLHKEKFTAK